MFDHNVIALFHSLRGPYSRAAAGLIDDICVELGAEAQRQPFDSNKIYTLTHVLRECFRPMDTDLPECHPWDQAYASFGKFLWRDNDVLQIAVREIAGWPDDKLQTCKNDYRDSARIIRDEWQMAVDQLDNAD